MSDELPPHCRQLLSENILELLDDAIVCIDGSQHILYASQGVEDVFGYKPNSLHGKPLEMLLPAFDHRIHEGHAQGNRVSPNLEGRLQAHQTVMGVRKDDSTFRAQVALAERPSIEGASQSW